MIKKISVLFLLLLLWGCTTLETEKKNISGSKDITGPEKDNPLSIPGIDKRVPSVADFYSDQFEIGTCVELDQLTGPEAELVKKHFSSLTAENIMKPQYMSPGEGKVFFAEADRLVEFARANGKLVRGHTLVWHQQNAKWMFYDDEGNKVSREVLLARMEDYITTVVSHYKGKIYAWDVVNEAFGGDGLRTSEWYGICGEEYIERAFYAAHEADPEAKLFINDYETTEPAKRDIMYNYVKKMMEKGVPVDGVGLQFHINLEYPGLMAVKQALDKFSSLGLEIHITELDMSVNGDKDLKATEPDKEILIRQAHRYKEIFDLFKQYKNITSVTFWGFQDGHTWLTSSPVKKPDWPLLFDKNLNTKLAFWGIVDPSRLPPDVIPETPDNNHFVTTAKYGTPGIDGEAEALWNTAEEIGITNFLEGDGAYGLGKALWDEENLYVFIKVKDNNLSRAHTDAYQQDSVEIFVDELNNKSAEYLEDDAQYRLNYVNDLSGRGNQAEITSVVVVTEDGYNIEARIPLRFVKPAPGVEMGFDLQVNDDAGEGQRSGFAKWNDKTNETYRNTSGFGTIRLEK